jgi:hypothetical protein
MHTPAHRLHLRRMLKMIRMLKIFNMVQMLQPLPTTSMLLQARRHMPSLHMPFRLGHLRIRWLCTPCSLTSWRRLILLSSNQMALYHWRSDHHLHHHRRRSHRHVGMKNLHAPKSLDGSTTNVKGRLTTVLGLKQVPLTLAQVLILTHLFWCVWYATRASEAYVARTVAAQIAAGNSMCLVMTTVTFLQLIRLASFFLVTAGDAVMLACLFVLVGGTLCLQQYRWLCGSCLKNLGERERDREGEIDR